MHAMAVGSRRRQGDGNNVCYQGLSSIGKWRVSARRTSSLATVVARHFAPRIVGTCCRFNSSAIAVSVAKPAARSSLMTVAKAMARASAARLCAAPPLCPRLRAGRHSSRQEVLEMAGTIRLAIFPCRGPHAEYSRIMLGRQLGIRARLTYRRSG
jgi:hypothetical protein